MFGITQFIFKKIGWNNLAEHFTDFWYFLSHVYGYQVISIVTPFLIFFFFKKYFNKNWFFFIVMLVLLDFSTSLNFYLESRDQFTDFEITTSSYDSLQLAKVTFEMTFETVIYIVILSIIFFFFISSFKKTSSHSEKTWFFILFIIYVSLSCSNNFLLFYLLLEAGNALFYYMLVNAWKQKETKTRWNNHSHVPQDIAPYLNYFIVNLLGSFFIILGFSFIYAVFSSISIGEIAILLTPSTKGIALLTGKNFEFGFFTLVCGLTLKLGLAPFHFWVAPIYEHFPTRFFIFIQLFPKASIFYFFIKLANSFQINCWEELNIMLICLGTINLIFGTLGAIYQYSVKRIIFYSSFANLGPLYYVIALGSNYSAVSVIYLLVYLITIAYFSLYFFAISETQKIAKKWTVEAFTQGLTHIAAKRFILGLLNLSGVPPFSLFFGKVIVMLALFENKFFLSLAFFMLFSVISAFYAMQLFLLSFRTEYFSSWQPIYPIELSSSKTVEIINAAFGLLFSMLFFNFYFWTTFENYAFNQKNIWEEADFFPFFLTSSIFDFNTVMSFITIILGLGSFTVYMYSEKTIKLRDTFIFYSSAIQSENNFRYKSLNAIIRGKAKTVPLWCTDISILSPNYLFDTKKTFQEGVKLNPIFFTEETFVINASDFSFFMGWSIIAFLFFSFLAFVARLFGRSQRFVRTKGRSLSTPYECGFNPFSGLVTSPLFLFYRLGVIFIIFEAEIIFLVPWAIGLTQSISICSVTPFFAPIFFIFILFYGFKKEIDCEALDV